MAAIEAAAAPVNKNETSEQTYLHIPESTRTTICGMGHLLLCALSPPNDAVVHVCRTCNSLIIFLFFQNDRLIADIVECD